MLGKIASLPPPIQEQLNQRLQNHETAKTLLPWLNALPETKAVLDTHFAGAPITQQNLSEHRRHGFLDWLDRQHALEFASTLDAGDADLQKVLPAGLAEKLSRWVFLRYVASARNLSTTAAGSDKSLRHLRDLSLFSLALRRGELSSSRLALERQRLALLAAESDAEKQTEFWEWTRRPEIQAKLYPHRDPERTRRQVDRMISGHLLGIRYPEDELEEAADPAALI